MILLFEMIKLILIGTVIYVLCVQKKTGIAYLFTSLMNIDDILQSGLQLDFLTMGNFIKQISVFFGLIGVTNGLCNVLGSSTWAEIYGVKYIGSIKALTTALMVFATAFGTAVFGILIDKGFSIEQISLVSAAYISISIISLFFIRKNLNPVKI